MVEDCPIGEVCRRFGGESYGSLVNTFGKSDELGWRTLRTIYSNIDPVKVCQTKNPSICPASRIMQAVFSSRQQPQSSSDTISLK